MNPPTRAAARRIDTTPSNVPAMVPARSAFKVHLFSNFEGDRQLSMLRYADQLWASLSQNNAADCELQRFAPSYSGGSVTGFGSRWKKYVEYPFLAMRHSGPVNHILDHGNSHLIRFLPAERTLVTCHDLIPLRLGDLLSTFSKRTRHSFKMNVMAMRKAARVLAISHSTKKDLVELLNIPEENISVIHYGLDHDTFRPPTDAGVREAARKRLGFTWPYTLLHVGAPAFYKNLEGAFETLAILRQRFHLDVHLVRAGGSLTEAQEELLRKRGLESSVHNLGSKKDEALRELYYASDVLFFPSWWEGFGWPPLEAMACGTPVVVSNRASMPEVSGDAATYVEPNDTENMANVVRRLLEDPALRDRLSQAGLQKVQQFQWSLTAQKTLQAYQEVWENARSAS